MIRPTEDEDTAAMLDVWEDAVRATHSFLSGDDMLFYKERLPGYISQVEPYVYEEDGKIKGFLGLSSDSIEMLFVGDRGKGIGTALLDYAVKDKGAAKVDVNIQNGQALGFYTKYGFRRTGISETDPERKPYPIVHLKIDKL